MTFEQTLAWLTVFVAGALMSFLQTHFPDEWPARLPPRLIATILAVLGGLGAYLITFKLNLPIFPDIKSPLDIWNLVLLALLALGGNQLAFGFFYAKEYYASKRKTALKEG